MVALWIRLGTALAGETALGVRLLAPLAAAGRVGAAGDAAERLFPGRRLGVPAAALLNATLMLGAGAVTMTPDTPLLFFAVLALWALVRARAQPGWWLLVGAAVGLALDSKYTGGAARGWRSPLWLVWGRAWRSLRSPWLWAGGLLALALFAPVILWNAGHGWASFVKQGGRTGDWRPAAAARFLGELFAGPVRAGDAAHLRPVRRRAVAQRRGASRRDPVLALLAALVLPGLLIFVEHALGDRVQANWLAILYPPLAIAAAAAGARWWRAAAGFGLALTALVYLQAAAAPFALPRRLDPTLIRLAGWDGLAQQADALRRATGLAFLASEEYGEAALLAWWAPAATAVVGAEARWALFRLPQPQPRRRRAAADQRAAARRSGPGALGGGCGNRPPAALPRRGGGGGVPGLSCGVAGGGAGCRAAAPRRRGDAELDPGQLARPPGQADADLPRPGRAERDGGAAGRLSAAGVRRRGAPAAAGPGSRLRGPGFRAAGRRLRRELRRLHRQHHPRHLPRAAADGGRPHLRRQRAGGEARAHGRAVRQAALGRARRRRTARRCPAIAATSSTGPSSPRRRACPIPRAWRWATSNRPAR